MNQPASVALRMGGVIRIIFGAAASGSIGSSCSRLFTGVPTDQATRLRVGGGVAMVGGSFGLRHGSKSA